MSSLSSPPPTPRPPKVPVVPPFNTSPFGAYNYTAVAPQAAQMNYYYTTPKVTVPSLEQRAKAAKDALDEARRGTYQNNNKLELSESLAFASTSTRNLEPWHIRYQQYALEFEARLAELQRESDQYWEQARQYRRDYEQRQEVRRREFFAGLSEEEKKHWEGRI